MKTKFLTLRSFTLLLVMALSIGSVWGADPTVTIYFGSNSGRTNVATGEKTESTTGIKFSAAIGGGSNNPGASGTYNTIYGGNTFTITIPSTITVSTIVLRPTSNSYPATNFTCDDGTTLTDDSGTGKTTWNGSAKGKTLVFSNGSSSSTKSCRLQVVTITYTAGSTIKHGVNWYVNGTKTKTDSVAEGGSITLPTNPSAPTSCSSKSFYGWTETASYSSETTAPTIITNPTMGTSDLNYYAVFADVTGDPNYYIQGNNSNLKEGAVVVLYENSSKKILNTTSYSSSTIPYTTQDLVNSKLPTSAIVDGMKWVVSIDNSKYQFKQGTKYLTSKAGYSLYFDATSDSWSVEDATNGYKLKSSTASSSFPYLGHYSGGANFDMCASGSASTINFFVPSVTYSNYVTTCKSCEHLITITKGMPEHGSFDMTGAGSNICVDDATASVSLSNITADSHYHATAVTTSAASGGGTPSAISDGSATVTGILATTTINVTFEEDTKYTVTFLNNGKKVESIGTKGVKTYYAGETLGTLPSQGDMEPCHTTSTTFMGWLNSDTGISTPQKDAPTMVTSSTVVNADMTLRAVWAKAQ